MPKIKELKFYETFNRDLLQHIIDNEKHYKSQIRKSCFEEDNYDPFKISKNYLSKANNQSYNTTIYKQCYNRNRGRYFADKSLSLQNICREIRHTISKDLYRDLDFVNCHPVILQHICTSHNIKTPYLDYYISNRDKVLLSLNIGRDNAKDVILSLINGGVKKYNELQKECKFIIGFKNECELILNKVETLYPEEFKFQSKKNKKLIEKGIKNWINNKGSTLNSIFCDIENNMLMLLLDLIKDKLDNNNINIQDHPIVLCFDGIMIGNHKILDDKLLIECEKLIFDKMGINIKLKYKPMNNHLIISDKLDDKKNDKDIISKALNTLLHSNFTDKEIVDYFIVKYKDYVYSFDNKIYMFKKHTWRIYDNSILYKLLSDDVYQDLHKLSNKLYKSNYKMLEDKSKKMLKLYSESSLSHVVKLINIFIKINDDIWDNKPHLLGFKNGIYDLDNNKFRDGKPDDYISLIAPYNYKPVSQNKKDKFLNGFFKQIMPMEDEGKELLKILSTCLYGKTLENFIILTGTGRNGKDTLLNLVETVLGDGLFYYNSVSVLCSRLNNSGLNQMVANMDKKRVIVYNEPDKNSNLKCSVIKELTGNNKINARGLYSKKTKVLLHGTHILMCNEIPELDEVDKAIANRLTIIPFRSLFYTRTQMDKLNSDVKYVYEVNTYYKTHKFKQDNKLVFLNILIDYFNKFKNDGHKLDCNVKSINEETEEYMEECDDLLNWFNETYEKSNNDYIKMCNMYNQFRASDLYINLTKRAKRRNNRKRLTKTVKNDPNFRGLYYPLYQKDGLYLKNIIYGYKLRKIELNLNY
jgi:P4 family phage/plasmid primase-like protien